MLLSNFLFGDIKMLFIYLNISMILNTILIWWFSFDVTTSSHRPWLMCRCKYIINFSFPCWFIVTLSQSLVFDLSKDPLNLLMSKHFPPAIDTIAISTKNNISYPIEQKARSAMQKSLPEPGLFSRYFELCTFHGPNQTDAT